MQGLLVDDTTSDLDEVHEARLNKVRKTVRPKQAQFFHTIYFLKRLIHSR
jgi:hypothetical protein